MQLLAVVFNKWQCIKILLNYVVCCLYNVCSSQCALKLLAIKTKFITFLKAHLHPFSNIAHNIFKTFGKILHTKHKHHLSFLTLSYLYVAMKVKFGSHILEMEILMDGDKFWGPLNQKSIFLNLDCKRKCVISTTPKQILTETPNLAFQIFIIFRWYLNFFSKDQKHSLYREL